MSKTYTFRVSAEQVREFADRNGYLEVWRSWRDTMLAQGRTVPEIRMRADTLPDNDIALDKQIAYDLIVDFLTWLDCPICSSLRDHSAIVEVHPAAPPAPPAPRKVVEASPAPKKKASQYHG